MHLRQNLLSVRRLEMANIRSIFDKVQVFLYKNDILVGLCHRDKLYEINFKVQTSKCLNIEIEDENTKLWHGICVIHIKKN